MGRKDIGKKEQIIDVMYDLFTEKGYYASMADISSLVGIKVQSIYSHYKSKNEIVTIMLEREMFSRFSSFNAELDVVLEKNSKEGLKSIFFSIYTHYKDRKKLKFWKNISLIPDEELKSWCRNKIRENELANQEKLRLIFEKGKAQGELRYKSIEAASNLYVAMIHGILDGMLLYQNFSLDMDEYIEKIWDEYWDSISIQ